MESIFPPGYQAWTCPICTAFCNFEAMCMCVKNADKSAVCGFDIWQPESAGGAFEFMVKIPEPEI